MFTCATTLLQLLLLPLLLGGVAGTLPAMQQHEQSLKDSRFITYQDLLATSKRFYDPETAAYSELLFDVGRNQLIVGARDQLYRMSFDLVPLERASWRASRAQMDMCQNKGQSEQMCRNYVRVLLSDGENQLYACGTNAFSPICSWRQMENLTALALDSGVGKCPFNPRANITSLMTGRSGRVFVGTSTDFSGSDAAIIRTDVRLQQAAPPPTFGGSSSNGGSQIIRTKQYNNNWLNSPQFVGSFEAGNFVYFLFREAAMEYINCGKVVYSRIARVCKNDVGGDQMLRDNWTSFLKARLNCSLPGEYPFYFNEIQGMTYSNEQNMLYASFSTAENSIYGSAVCAYNLSAINEAFDGPFKYQEHGDSPWRSVRSAQRGQFDCEAPVMNQRYKQLVDSSIYHLMDAAVQPLTQQPLHVARLERYTHIALDTVATQTERLHVLYVATTANQIKKLAVKHRPAALGGAPNPQTCLVEAWQLSEPGAERILTMEYLKVTDSLYVGTDLALTRIPAQRCSRHVSQSSCLNAMDPYCGWNELTERCTPQEMVAQMSKFWIQPDVLHCPILDAPIDGGWSSWGEWFECHKRETEGDAGDDDGNCLCRNRACDNPLPQNGGQRCEGITTQVQNCTVHGGWTEWSAWSACSQTCGIAVKTRRRSCGNPKPSHGGRTCVGQEQAEMYCRHLPPCPAPKSPAIDGGWGPWGEWSECSAQCGGGFRMRRRECNDPSPLNGGMECPGCTVDYEPCGMHHCAEARKLSAWTPWLVQQNDSEPHDGSGSEQRGGQYAEKRFRFICKATTADAASLRINLAREETRLCRADGSCQRHSSAGDSQLAASPSGVGADAAEPAEHEHEWSICSVSCGGGVQQRLHRGRHLPQHSRACNVHACPALATDGWGAWSEWSACTGDGKRFRHRECQLDDGLCTGAEYEKAVCLPANCEATAAIGTASISMLCAIFILTHACVAWIAVRLTSRRCLARAVAHTLKNVPATPTYDSAPNQYSSLPTKDIYDVRPKVKRQSSFNMCSPSKYCNGNGTLNRNNINHNHTPKVLSKTYNDCETGTLKRHSNALNNHHRSNIDDEKF